MSQVSIGHAEKTIPFSIQETALMIFERYPNPFSKHIQSTDFLAAPTLGDDGELYGKCLTMKTNPMPKWFKNSSQVGFNRNGSRCIAIAEEYLIDPKARTLWHLSWNTNSRDFLKTHELVQYVGDGADKVKVYKSMATASPIRWPVQSMMTKFAVNRWLKNERRATHGLCYSIAKNLYCENLANEFHTAGLNDGAIEKMKSKVKTMREVAKDRTRQGLQEITVAMKNPQNLQKIVEVVKKAPRP